ncbi:hypothetical protein [Marivirga lumbricoides]
MSHPVVVYDTSNGKLANILDYELKKDGLNVLDLSQRDNEDVIEWKFLPIRCEYRIRNSELMPINVE